MAGSACRHVCLHLDWSKASSGVAFTCCMSSLIRSIHRFLSLLHGCPCYSVLFAAHDMSIPTKPSFPHFRNDCRWTIVGRCRSWRGRVILVCGTSEALAFPSRVGPARALLSLANTPICRGRLGAPLSCRSLTWDLGHRTGFQSPGAISSRWRWRERASGLHCCIWGNLGTWIFPHSSDFIQWCWWFHQFEAYI